jgi:hypothetical protein
MVPCTIQVNLAELGCQKIGAAVNISDPVNPEPIR